MLPTFTDIEARIIGCLMEKSLVTPDQYPLTPNALTNACNQKSSRDPVMSLDQGKVQHVARELKDKHLLHIEENFKSGVEKYKQRFCNSTFSTYKFDHAQFAIICLLLLRGPQTPGELRARSGRLHAFEDNSAVVDALNSLVNWEGDPLVVKLPRMPGRKDSEYMHLFCGPIDVEAHTSQAETDKSVRATERLILSELAERISRLESEMAALKEKLTAG